MEIQMRSIFIGSVVVSIVCTILLLLLWGQGGKRYPGISAWIFFFLLGAVGILMIASRGYVPSFFSIVIGNELLLIGMFTGLLGIEKFVGKRCSHRFEFFLLGLFPVTMAFFTFVMPDISIRSMLFYSSMGYFSILILKVTSLNIQKISVHSSSIIGFVFIGYTVGCFFRLIQLIFFPDGSDPFGLPVGGFNVFSILMYQGLTMILPYGLTLMVNRRLISEVRVEEAKFSTIFRMSPFAILLTRVKDGEVIDANRGFLEMTGYARDELIGKKTTDIGLWNNSQNRVDSINRMGKTGENARTEYYLGTKSGDTFLADVSMELIPIDGEDVILSNIADITDRRKMEVKMVEMAMQDPLTGLPNRVSFSDRIECLLSEIRIDLERFALMFIDLDKFKPINDEYGHAVGDVILKEAAKRMSYTIRSTDMVGRIGGDEFVVLLPSISCDKDALHVAEKIRRALAMSFDVDGMDLNISCSIGVALFPEHGTDEIELFKNADMAMYQAKSAGGDSIRIFHPEQGGMNECTQIAESNFS